MTASRGVGICCALFRFYPRAFRDEYGLDMALLFAAQLRDEPAGRVWARGLLDLAITIPTRHLEAHMTLPPNPIVPSGFAAVSVAGLLLSVVGGSSTAMLGIGLAIAIFFGGLAGVAWRRSRPITSQPIGAHWWKFAVAGPALLVATLVALNATGEVPDGWWWPMILTFFAAIVATLTGLILGAARVASRAPGAEPR